MWGEGEGGGGGGGGGEWFSRACWRCPGGDIMNGKFINLCEKSIYFAQHFWIILTE